MLHVPSYTLPGEFHDEFTFSTTASVCMGEPPMAQTENLECFSSSQSDLCISTHYALFRTSVMTPPTHLMVTMVTT